MARLGNGTSAKVLATAAYPLIGTGIYSWHFWYRNDVAAPSAANIKQPMTLGVAGNNARTFFSWNHTNAASRQAVGHRNSVGTYFDCKLTTSLTTGIWYPIGATWDGTNVRAYLFGVNEATTAVNSINTAAATPGVLANASPNVSFDQGVVSDFAYWDVVLSPAEMVMLAKNRSPLTIRRRSLGLYWPLDGTPSTTERDISGNNRHGLVTAAAPAAGPFGLHRQPYRRELGI